MTSLILKTATRYMLPLLLLFSVFVMLRGHNEPGGGFVGGLVAAAGFALYMVAYDAESARRILRVNPRTFIGVGLLLAVASGVSSFLFGDSFLTGLWTEVNVGGVEKVALGTPLMFDAGVYLVVMGVTLMIVLSLAEER